MSIRPVVFGVVLGIVVMGGLGLLLDRLGIIDLCPEPPREYNAIAVLPLTEAEGDAGALANSVCDQLAIQLTQKGLPVIPWFRTRRISLTRDLKEIGAELSADVLIHGSLVVEDGRVRGVVRLRNLAERGSDFRVEVNAPVGDPLITARFIARKISYELRPLKAPDLPEQTREDALELARRGNDLIRLGTEEATLKAKDLFKQALAIDPGLAEAYVGMGTFYYRSNSSPQALAMYELALELDPGSVPARRGMVMIYWAVAEFEKGLALAGSSPGDMDPRERLTLVGEAYVKCGLPRRAVPILEAARVLAPEDDGVLWNLVMAYNWSGRYREAVDCSLEFFRKFGDNG